MPVRRNGRVAQRERTPFTREGSQVQSLSRPPYSALILFLFWQYCFAPIGSYRQNVTGRRRKNPWKIRGLCSTDVHLAETWAVRRPENNGRRSVSADLWQARPRPRLYD